MSHYNKRVWLNEINNSSTGSVVCFHGNVKWNSNPNNEQTFLEIADCHDKIRLHKNFGDSNLLIN